MRTMAASVCVAEAASVRAAVDDLEQHQDPLVRRAVDVGNVDDVARLPLVDPLQRRVHAAGRRPNVLVRGHQAELAGLVDAAHVHVRPHVPQLRRRHVRVVRVVEGGEEPGRRLVVVGHLQGDGDTTVARSACVFVEQRKARDSCWEETKRSGTSRRYV